MALSPDKIYHLQMKSDKYILVHADGGKCHGTPLDKNGKCPECGIYPDMQSIEFWTQEKIDIERKWRQ